VIKLENEKNTSQTQSGYHGYNRDFTRSKKEGTPGFEVLLRRFFREVQQSRILSEAKKRRFHSKDITRKEKREIARHKTMIKKLKRGY
jgi:ribosomal protein S21